MFRTIAVAVSAATVVLASGAASAQQEDDITKGMSCVYDRVASDAWMLIAEQYLYGAVSADEEKKIGAALDAAEQGCADALSLSEEQAALSREIGIYGIAADYLAEELLDMGVSEEDLETLYGFYQGLNEQDYERIYLANWRDDADFVAKMKAGLTQNGLPDDDDALQVMFDMIEITVLSEDAGFTYMMGDLGDDLDEAKQ